MRHLSAGGVLGESASPGVDITLQSADGANHDGTPYKPATFTASGLTGKFMGGSIGFSLAVDSGTAVGNAVQVQISYDFTGNGSWDRIETYRYFAIDPLVGAENYMQKSGLASVTGSMGNLTAGVAKVEVWSALPGADSSTRPVVLANSSVVLPYS